jgi:hypothetical protein
MLITYDKPDGTVEQVSTNDLSAIESADIEEVLDGASWRQIEDRVSDQDPTAMRAVLWVVRKREQPNLAFSDVDVPGWRRRLKARIERQEIDEVLQNLLAEDLAKVSEDSAIQVMLPHLRKLAHDKTDVGAALEALGKGHLGKPTPASEG